MKRILVVVALATALSAVRAQDVGPLPTRLHVRNHLLGAPAAPGSVAPGPRDVSGRKSPALAAVYSLLLPGMGELYAGSFDGGKYFLIAESALWLTFTVFEVHGNSLRDDARAFAVSRAGIDPRGKDDQFFVDIGNFLDIDEHNEKQLRDREPERLYDPAAGYAWRWASDADRALYRSQRIDAETMFNNKKFVVAAVIINHVASAINAARSVIAGNAAREDELSIRAEVLGTPAAAHGIMVTVTRPF